MILERMSDSLLPMPGAPGARLGRALLWQPSFVCDDKMLWHVPFLFWLLETTQPKQYVQIGVGEGVDYMAICQALHRMRIQSRCYAVRNWSDGNPRPADPDRFAVRNADLYGDFSEILDHGVEDAADAIGDQAVDLMLVDLTAAPGAAGSFHKCWHSKLSRNGILLINGIDGGDAATSVLVNALSANSPTVRLPGGDGLLVVLPTSETGDEFSRLAALAPEDPAQKLIIEMFTRLGAATYQEVNLREKDRQVEALDEKAKELWQERNSLVLQLGEVRAQYASRHHKAAILQSREYSLQQAAAEAQSEIERLTADIASIRAELDKARWLLGKEKTAREGAGQDREAAAAELAELMIVIAEEGRRSEEQARQHQRLADEIASAKANEARLHQQLNAETEARADAVKASQAAAGISEQLRNACVASEAALEKALADLDTAERARATAEVQRKEAVQFAEQDKSSRIAAEAQRDEAFDLVEQERISRTAAEAQRDEAFEFVEQEKMFRAAAEAQRDEAIQIVAIEKVARAKADDKLSEATNEAGKLRSRITELMREMNENYSSFRSLIELAEQNENIISALGEELRLTREQVRACLVAPVKAAL